MHYNAPDIMTRTSAMRYRIPPILILLSALALTGSGKPRPPRPIPHLEKRGTATAIDRGWQALSGLGGRID